MTQVKNTQKARLSI